MTPARDLLSLARLLLGYAALCAWERIRGTRQVEERIDPEDEPRNCRSAPRLYPEACDCERGCWACDEVEREA